MEDPVKAVQTNLANIIELFKENRFEQCLQLSKNILNLSSELNMTDQNIMCKIIFDGLLVIQDIERKYIIPEEIKNNLNTNVLTSLNEVYKAHVGNDNAIAYSTLKVLQDIFVRIKQDSVLFPVVNYPGFLQDPRFITDDEEEDDDEEEEDDDDIV